MEAAVHLMSSRSVEAHDVQDRLDDLQAPIRMKQETYLTVLATIGSSAVEMATPISPSGSWASRSAK